METTLKFVKLDDKTLIKLGNRINPRVRILFLIEFFAALIGATLFSYLILSGETPTETLFFGSLGMVALFIMLAYRYGKRLFTKEEIEIGKEHISLIERTLFSRRQNNYDVSKILDFSYNGRPKYSDHPLKGESFDYLGFDTEQKKIQNLHEENTFSFRYNGKLISFGKDIYSWEAEEIENAIYQLVGRDLRNTETTNDQISS